MGGSDAVASERPAAEGQAGTVLRPVRKKIPADGETPAAVLGMLPARRRRHGLRARQQGYRPGGEISRGPGG